MLDDRWFLRQLWRRSAGLSEEAPAEKKMPSLDSLRGSEWSERFEELMRNRMVMGAFRYGLMQEKRLTEWDYLRYLKAKVEEYRQTGNLECLVDVGNLAMLEFEFGEHPKRHFAAADDGVHCEVKI